jgi:hypothetical protein
MKVNSRSGSALSEQLRLAVVGHLLEAGVEDPASDGRAQVGPLTPAARPDHAPSRGEHARDGRDGAPDVAVGDVAEDAAEHEQIDRQHVGERRGLRRIRDPHGEPTDPGGGRARLRTSRELRVELDEDSVDRALRPCCQLGHEVATVTGAEAQHVAAPAVERVERLAHPAADPASRRAWIEPGSS